MSTRGAIAAVLVAILAVLTGTPARASDGTAVATGLDNPRGLAFGPDGALYVAEAGRGGRAPCRPGRGGELLCFGRSGAVTRIEDRVQRRVLWNLPSLASPSGNEAQGASDVAVGADGEVLHAYGKDRLLPAHRGRIVLTGRALLRVGPKGRAQAIATFAAPTSVVQGPDGAFYVSERTRVWRAEPGRAPRLHATGFTGIVDLAWSPRKDLYVLESGGALRQGTRRIASGLTAPGGLAVRGRYAYVTTCAVCAGAGEVVRATWAGQGREDRPSRSPATPAGDSGRVVARDRSERIPAGSSSPSAQSTG